MTVNKYPYLRDKAFLKQVDEASFKEQYIRIFVLDFKTEKVLANIEGKSTGGSCNLSGTSNMRRTASCSLVVDPNGIDGQQYYNITEVRNLISMNKKVRIETGFKNTFWDYEEYDIIWFPLGTYVIKTASISQNNSGINISLTLNDKCALLNGDMGGTIPAATVFSESELYNASGTSRTVEKILIKDVIKNLVVEFGGENPDNVIITDIPDTIVKVMKWNGNAPLYLIEEAGKKRFTLDNPGEGVKKEEFTYGMDVGYMNEPFVYPGTLECNAGEAVAAVLDKIKNTLGNFEWFYDIDGRFIFQEIKNYLNTSVATKLIELTEKDYFDFQTVTTSEYSFDNKQIITSISNAPQFQNIKNDYVVWGTTKTATGADKPIRYHLVFDSKPPVDKKKKRLCIVYTDYRGLQQVVPMIEGVTYAKITEYNEITKDEETIKIPKIENFYSKDLYYIDVNNKKIYHWDDEEGRFREYATSGKYIELELCYLMTDDWRTELYFRGLEASNKTFSKNYYAAELNAEWPKIYNVKAKEVTDVALPNDAPWGITIYKGDYRTDMPPESYEYWLDFLEGDTGISQSISPFSVDNIGRRTKVVTDNNSNCIFPVEVPNYIIVEADGDVSKEITEIESKGQEAIQVSPEIFKNLTLGGRSNAAYDKIKELLYLHTSYNESISLSVIPIYYLEPNTRISVSDNKTGISGDYLIKTISLPLTINGTSNISAVRCIDKTF